MYAGAVHILALFGLDHAIPIKVQDPKGFYSHIIVAVRKIKETQGWINVIHRAERM